MCLYRAGSTRNHPLRLVNDKAYSVAVAIAVSASVFDSSLDVARCSAKSTNVTSEGMSPDLRDRSVQLPRSEMKVRVIAL